MVYTDDEFFKALTKFLTQKGREASLFAISSGATTKMQIFVKPIQERPPFLRVNLWIHSQMQKPGSRIRKELLPIGRLIFTTRNQKVEG